MQTATDTKGFNEENFTKFIERQTAGLQSNTLLWASAGIIAFAIALKLLKQKKTASFIKQLAIPVLLVGINNKFRNQERAKSRTF